MKAIWISIVKNGGVYPETAQYMHILRKEGFSPQVSEYYTNFKLSYKEFLPKKWGLDGIKAKVREVVPPESNNIVLFFYKPTRQVHSWTYPNPLTEGDVFCEIPYSEEWTQWSVEAAIHEGIGHAFHRIIWWRGIGTRDTMDNYDTELGGLEENLTRIRPYYYMFPTPYAVLSRMRKVIALAGMVLSLIQKLLKNQSQNQSKISVEIPGGIEAPIKQETMQDMVRRVCKEENLDPQMAERLYKTIECESNFNPKAKHVNTNGTTDWGLCQFNDGPPNVSPEKKWWIGPEKALDSVQEAIENPEKCVRIMAREFKTGRAYLWVCYKKLFG